ncbi:SAM-dependent DNA methyltransferase [Candidatus Saccharibacteria bacterium]|nr:SAM-dependent DNA methyltransferase [Candidatus Saccharibacteria bacterium]
MEIQDIQAKLWLAADKLRGNISSSDYKYVVLGLIFLKYVSDAFEVQYKKAEAEGFNPEDRDYYLGDNVFWVPKEARWEHLVATAKQPNIGIIVDEAMDAVERDNPSLKGVLPKNYAREALDKRRLGELIDLFANTMFTANNAKDLLGQVYEYFMGMFANSEGKHGGEFFTPRSIVKLLVEMLEPYKGRIYDPACGSGGMFVWSEKFVEEHSGRLGDIAIYGQELNETTWRLGKMNMAIRGIDADLRRGDTLHDDKFPDLKADYIIANPPFNISDWGQDQLTSDIRWKYGVPPKGNANYAWIQHFIHHLSPTGTAGFVLSNGSMSSQSSGEGEIRKKLIEADLVDAIVTLPGQLFFNTGIPACLWFISRDRRNRTGKTLFIDGRNLGKMVTRRNRVIRDEEIDDIAGIYRQFKENGKALWIKGLSKVATLDDIKEHDYVLTPGRYVGSEAVEDDDELFVEKMARLTAELDEQFAKSKELEEKIKENLRHINDQ